MKTQKPNRFIPSTTSGRIFLLLVVMAAALAGFWLEPREPWGAPFAVLVLLALYGIWRNILISFGLMGSDGTQPNPDLQIQAETEVPPKDGRGSKILMIVLVLAALIGVRACGEELGGFLSNSTWLD